MAVLDMTATMRVIMSAKMKTFLEIKKVVDHDCGNYRMGEIDFVDYGQIENYIAQYGEYGYSQFLDTLNRCHVALNKGIMEYRSKKNQEQCGAG